MEKRKVGYLAGQKQYNEARILPKALKIYGEMIFQCAEMKEKMLAVSGQLKNNLAIGQSIWAFYDEILTAAHQQKNRRINCEKTTN